MKKIIGKTYDEERALYGLSDVSVQKCIFAGDADGESVLKECHKIDVENCSFSLRYPLWHAKDFSVTDCEMDVNTRAALWYCENGKIAGCSLGGIKAVRECKNVTLTKCNIISEEFGWRNEKLQMTDCSAESKYFLFECKNIIIDNVTLNGKYSFQYVKNAAVNNCNLTTKDAFWHAKNVTVKNSILKGEYLGWYSEGLTLINCVICGTQPLCYCKNLRLINCRMENCDLSFEYSDVHATVNGNITSVKNPKSGVIVADSVGEIIFSDSIVKCKGKVKIR